MRQQTAETIEHTTHTLTFDGIARNKMDKFIANFICILTVQSRMFRFTLEVEAIAIGNKSIALLTFISNDYVSLNDFLSIGAKSQHGEQK